MGCICEFGWSEEALAGRNKKKSAGAHRIADPHTKAKRQFDDFASRGGSIALVLSHIIRPAPEAFDKFIQEIQSSIVFLGEVAALNLGGVRGLV